MEYITPEEIAVDVVREIRGYPTGKDIVAALDAATSGPTYRAGVLREVALERMEALEREHGVEAVAYEMLGPPRLSKLLFESAILGRLYGSLAEVRSADADSTAKAAHDLIRSDADLRGRILTIGLPIVLPDGRSMLRGPDVKIRPADGQSPTDGRLMDAGWVDLRAANWRKWSERAGSMLAESAMATWPSTARARTRSRQIAAYAYARAAWHHGCSGTRIAGNASSDRRLAPAADTPDPGQGGCCWWKERCRQRRQSVATSRSASAPNCTSGWSARMP
jgi:hypothetical protein